MQIPTAVSFLLLPSSPTLRIYSVKTAEASLFIWRMFYEMYGRMWDVVLWTVFTTWSRVSTALSRLGQVVRGHYEYDTGTGNMYYDTSTGCKCVVFFHVLLFPPPVGASMLMLMLMVTDAG